MAELAKHWTENSTADFLYRIASDYTLQIENMMESEGVTQAELASALGVTEGRVSQVLNNPGNLTLKKIIEYARAFGKKIAIVAYDDGDGSNQNGPVNSEIFRLCWERCGKPSDFFAMPNVTQQAINDPLSVVVWKKTDALQVDPPAHAGTNTFKRGRHVGPILGTAITESPGLATFVVLTQYRQGGTQWQSPR